MAHIDVPPATTQAILTELAEQGYTAVTDGNHTIVGGIGPDGRRISGEKFNAGIIAAAADMHPEVQAQIEMQVEGYNEGKQAALIDYLKDKQIELQATSEAKYAEERLNRALATFWKDATPEQPVPTLKRRVNIDQIPYLEDFTKQSGQEKIEWQDPYLFKELFLDDTKYDFWREIYSRKNTTGELEYLKDATLTLSAYVAPLQMWADRMQSLVDFWTSVCAGDNPEPPTWWLDHVEFKSVAQRAKDASRDIARQFNLEEDSENFEFVEPIGKPDNVKLNRIFEDPEGGYWKSKEEWERHQKPKQSAARAEERLAELTS